MIVLVCLAAIAATPAPELRLAEAEAALADANYETVAPLLAPLLADSTVAPELRSRAEILRGISLHNLLDETGAKEAFRAALLLDRAAELPDSTSPRTRELFREVARALPAPAVISEPPPVEQAPVLVETAPPAELSSGPPVWSGVAVLAAAVAAGSVGGALMISGSSGREEAQSIDDAAAAQARFDSADRSYRAGSGLLIGGAVFAAGGALLLTWALSAEAAP